MTTEPYVEYDVDDYTTAIANELPQGVAWPRDPNSSLMKWARGCAHVWADVAASGTRLFFEESDPRFTTEMLEDWETAYALPDPCVKVPLTVDQRRAALINKITVQGGCSKTFFINLAAYLGYTITITEYIPFVFGLSSFGIVGKENEIMRPDARYYWTVNIHGERLTRFEFGFSAFGNNPFLDLTTADDLACCINRWKPAHTIVVFNYLQS